MAIGIARIAICMLPLISAPPAPSITICCRPPARIAGIGERRLAVTTLERNYSASPARPGSPEGGNLTSWPDSDREPGRLGSGCCGSNSLMSKRPPEDDVEVGPPRPDDAEVGPPRPADDVDVGPPRPAADDADVGPPRPAADDVGPSRPEGSTAAPANKKRKAALEFEQLYLDNLPVSEMYEKSYMHRDVVTDLLVTPNDFIITASCDGQVRAHVLRHGLSIHTDMHACSPGEVLEEGSRNV